MFMKVIAGHIPQVLIVAESGKTYLQHVAARHPRMLEQPTLTLELVPIVQDLFIIYTPGPFLPSLCLSVHRFVQLQLLNLFNVVCVGLVHQLAELVEHYPRVNLARVHNTTLQEKIN